MCMRPDSHTQLPTWYLSTIILYYCTRPDQTRPVYYYYYYYKLYVSSFFLSLCFFDFCFFGDGCPCFFPSILYHHFLLPFFSVLLFARREHRTFFFPGGVFFFLCVGEKPTVLLYTYINRHAGTPKHIPQPKPTKNNVVVHKLDGI